MKVLLIGANGQVGQAFLNDKKQHIIVHAYDHASLDVTNYALLEKTFLEKSPDLVLNTSAYTNVDKAEKEKEQAFKVNCTGPENLAKLCAKANTPLIHLSTDYVFSGEKKESYLETDETYPINYYGYTKREGERAIQNSHKQHLILRVSAVFSAIKINFVKTLLRLAKEHSSLSVVNNQITCPTAALDIAKALHQIIQAIFLGETPWGIYHFCSAEAVSWYNFAKTIFEAAKLPVEITATDHYPCLAKRPAFSVLNCKKIHDHFSLTQPLWRTSLPSIINTLLRDT